LLRFKHVAALRKFSQVISRRMFYRDSQTPYPNSRLEQEILITTGERFANLMPRFAGDRFLHLTVTTGCEFTINVNIREQSMLPEINVCRRETTAMQRRDEVSIWSLIQSKRRRLFQVCLDADRPTYVSTALEANCDDNSSTRVRRARFSFRSVERNSPTIKKQIGMLQKKIKSMLKGGILEGGIRSVKARTRFVIIVITLMQAQNIAGIHGRSFSRI